MSRERDLSTFLLRVIVAGVLSGFIVGVIVFFNTSLIVSMLDKMTSQAETQAGSEAVEPYMDLAKSLLRLAPLTQPLNSAISIAILGLISWGIAGLARDRYKTAMITVSLLYGLITLASTYYMATIIGDPKPLYYIGVPSIASFIVILLLLEWKDLPGAEPEIT